MHLHSSTTLILPSLPLRRRTLSQAFFYSSSLLCPPTFLFSFSLHPRVQSSSLSTAVYNTFVASLTKAIPGDCQIRLYSTSQLLIITYLPWSRRAIAEPPNSRAISSPQSKKFFLLNNPNLSHTSHIQNARHCCSPLRCPDSSYSVPWPSLRASYVPLFPARLRVKRAIEPRLTHCIQSPLTTLLVLTPPLLQAPSPTLSLPTVLRPSSTVL